MKKLEENKVVVIILEVAVLLTIVIITCAVLQGDIFETFQEPSKYVLQSQIFTENEMKDTQDKENMQLIPEELSGGLTNSDSGNSIGGNGYQINLGGTQGIPEDVSGWSTSQIIEKAKQAVNRTKAYNNPLTVHHKESFEATVTECTGGSIVQSIANVMVGWVVKPVDETLNYTNGYAVNSEDETVPIILPKRGNFNLDSSGVTSASVKASGTGYIIKLNIVSESVGIGQVPEHNANSVGYLDVSSFDLDFMEIDSADITYKGSSIELHVNSKGYVTYAVYKVPLEIRGSAHKGSISGSATFVGEQSEIWTLSY